MLVLTTAETMTGRRCTSFCLRNQHIRNLWTRPLPQLQQLNSMDFVVKMNFDRGTVEFCLKGLSTITAGLFAGGALYVNAIEHPARMEATNMPTALTCWNLSNTRAGAIMSKIALTSSASSTLAYFATRGASKENIGWLVTGGMFMAIFPFTKLFIMPLINELKAVEESKEKGSDWIQNNLEHWNRAHSYRTFLSLGAFTTMVYLLIRG